MYAKSLHIDGFKCFGLADLRFQYPGRRGTGVSEIRNVNVILGDNGGGKSSVLRGITLALLAPALAQSGFVPYRLVRRAKEGEEQIRGALLTVRGVAGPHDSVPSIPLSKSIEATTKIARRGRGNLDNLLIDPDTNPTLSDSLFDDTSPAFFMVGYGATRRVETGEYSESSARRSRGARYQRVAGLFEDNVSLRPLQSWLSRLRLKNESRFPEVLLLMERALPTTVSFAGQQSDDGEEYLFDFQGTVQPFSSLSDGYKSFIGWISDLIGNLVDVAPVGVPLDALEGIVLVDEIDVHLHPEWQRSVVPTLAAAFPKLQFVVTTHSPLVASTVKRENVFVTDVAPDGTATIKQLAERIFGRSIEQLLLSSYFGLLTTKPDSFIDSAASLFKQAAEGDAEAALSYIARLTAATPRVDVDPQGIAE